MAFKDILDRHNDHTVVIIPRFYKNRPKLVPGLYCEDCGKLIKWLKDPLAEELVNDYGVERLSPIKEDRIKLFQQQLGFRDGIKQKLKRGLTLQDVKYGIRP